jgi:hypothetical protein
MKLSRQNFDEIHPDMKRAETSSFDYKLFNSISEEFKAFSDLISREKILLPPFEARKDNVEYSPSTILMFPSTFLPILEISFAVFTRQLTTQVSLVSSYP